MNNHTLWSLRLGYSAQQAATIKKLSLNNFLEQSFSAPFDASLPNFLENSPKSIQEFRDVRNKLKNASPEQLQEIRKQEGQSTLAMKAWWIEKMYQNELPLREKMTCFWHNHFVATAQKVKVNYWIFQHNQILREHAFGNYKTLTKAIIQSNAMVRYLDNVDNRKGKLNENLSRELLELFTLGLGNYLEEDIKNGAKGLAGLGIGEQNAVYRKFFEEQESFVYLGKKGNFKLNEMVDIIFDQPNISYLITRKILQWFIYDRPKEELVRYYGGYFKKMNFEIKPLLEKIFTEEFDKNTAGSKIKNPLEYSLQIMNELNISKPNTKLLAFFSKQQGMDLFDQPNVKGWDGGNSWLTSQIFLQRNNAADLLCNGKNLNRGTKNEVGMMTQNSNKVLNIRLHWNTNGTNKEIISELKDRLLFQTEDYAQADFEKILKYDFDPKTAGSENAVMRLFNYMIKTPEFQLI